ncbi:MAG: hypothetical protein WBP85_10425 [Terracidiphilus sp.]
MELMHEPREVAWAAGFAVRRQNWRAEDRREKEKHDGNQVQADSNGLEGPAYGNQNGKELG